MTSADTLCLDTVTVPLSGLCLRIAGPSGQDLRGHLILSTAVLEEDREGSTVWSSHWIRALVLQLLLICVNLKHIAVVFLFYICNVYPNNTPLTALEANPAAFNMWMGKNGLSGPDSPSHHGNTSPLCIPAAALVFCTLRANQVCSIL